MPRHSQLIRGLVVRRVGPVGLVLGCVLIAAAAAGAVGSVGGTSIAGAPMLQPGVQVTGNSSTDPTTTPGIGAGGCWNDLEYWRVALTAGDKVTLKATQASPGYNLEVGVFPAGTTDANIGHASAVASSIIVKGPVAFVAPTTGTYPVVIGPNCYDGVDGPFTITAAVTVGSLPKPAVTLQASAHLKARGTILATVKGADGTPITDPNLVLKLHASWKGTSERVLATASPRHGSARFTVHFPAGLNGETVHLHVTGSGLGYKATSSATVTATVA